MASDKIECAFCFKEATRLITLKYLGLAKEVPACTICAEVLHATGAATSTQIDW
jgi:hypothetical protein